MFNKSYEKNSAVWGIWPNALLRYVEIHFSESKGLKFLDLGSGQGRDTLYMYNKGFDVTTVDISSEGITQIEEKIQNVKKEKNNECISHCMNVAHFSFIPDYYTIINAFNIIHFMKKEAGLALVNKMKESVKKGGYIIISNFLNTDKSFHFKNNHENCYFNNNELKTFFPNSEFDIISYSEYSQHNPGHAGEPKPHIHEVVELIAYKN